MVGGTSPVAMATADSMDSVPEKAQQEPHEPWFLTGVTTPSSRQSTDEGRSVARLPAVLESLAEMPEVPGSDCLLYLTVVRWRGVCLSVGVLGS